MSRKAASISTHVLDVERGVPIADMQVELHSDGALISIARTDRDGRIARFDAGALVPGTYRLVFHVESRFLSRVAVDFAVADAARSYHIPLLLSSYACTAYRGT